MQTTCTGAISIPPLLCDNSSVSNAFSQSNLEQTSSNLNINALNLNQTGLNLKHSSSNLKHTGLNLKHSGSNLNQTASNLNQTGSSLSQTGSNLKHTGSQDSRFLKKPPVNPARYGCNNIEFKGMLGEGTWIFLYFSIDSAEAFDTSSMNIPHVNVGFVVYLILWFGVWSIRSWWCMAAAWNPYRLILSELYQLGVSARLLGALALFAPWPRLPISTSMYSLGPATHTGQ